ncbi:MAG: ShlB/FhaC/HecB family hemolysin secretion/activation protein [Desulfobacteraceae bacterium]|jgi:hemolysin activation/secretion protein
MNTRYIIYKNIMVKVITILFLMFTITTGTALAQQAPNIGDAVKQAAPPSKESPVKKEKKEIPVIFREDEKSINISDEAKIYIKDFKLESIASEDEAQLKDILTSFRNKELSMTEITQAANNVTIFYRNKGYLVAKAYIPKQEAIDGILTISVIMGNYGEFSIKNDSPVRDTFLQGVFDEIKKDSPVVTREGLERAMLLVKEMPGCNLPKIAISPGAVSGSSDFVINIDKSQRVNGYIMGDNQGSKYTGRKRAYGGITINSPFGIADKLSLIAMSSEDSGVQNIMMSYGLPVASNGLRAEVAASRTSYELGGIYSGLDAEGTAEVLEGTISYPLKRSSRENIDISLNLGYKDLQDDQNAVGSRNPRKNTSATMTVGRTSYENFLGRNLYTDMSGSISVGRLEIKDEVQKALNKAGADTDGAYSKLNISLSGNLAINDKLSLMASASIQKALMSKNLDAVEQMFISGGTGVKAYTESVSFDNGYVANMELRYSLPTFYGVKHEGGVFIDNGWVYAQEDDYVDDDDIMLTDAGLGYYASYKKLFGSVHLAFPIGKDDAVSDPGTRVLVQVGMSF